MGLARSEARQFLFPTGLPSGRRLEVEVDIEAKVDRPSGQPLQEPMVQIGTAIGGTRFPEAENHDLTAEAGQLQPRLAPRGAQNEIDVIAHVAGIAGTLRRPDPIITRHEPR